MSKDAPFDGIREKRRIIVANETHERLDDSNGNSCLLENKVCLACNSTTNLNTDLTIDSLKRVIFLYLKTEELNRGDMLVDDFKGHRTDPVKDCVKSFKSGDWLDYEEDRHGLVDFHTMAGGVTPKAQPLDFFPTKVMKGYCIDFYDIHMLTAPTNSRIWHPLMPSRQLFETWVVDAWDKVPESLTKKPGILFIIKKKDLQNESENVWKA